MFIRNSDTKNPKNGNVYHKYQLVKSKRVDGESVTELLLTLGKLEGLNDVQIKQLSDRINDLFTNQHVLFKFDDKVEDQAQYFVKKLLNKYFMQKKTLKEYNTGKPEYELVDVNSINTLHPVSIGGEFLCKQVFDELGLANFFQQKLGFGHLEIQKIFLSLIARLLYPSSERKAALWLNENSGAQEFFPLSSGEVNRNQLYRASLDLYENKDAMEKYISQKIRTIFNYTTSILLYDLTNTHFEGRMQQSTKAAYGRNKQKRNDCKQITIGVVADAYGFCQHSDYFSGNVSEPKTLQTILDSLASKCDVTAKRHCVVMDAGIATQDNLKLVLKNEMDYIAVSRDKHSDLKKEALESDLVVFKNKTGQEISAKIFKETIKYEDKEGVEKSRQEILLFVKSPEKELKEKSMDEKKCARFEQGLKSLQTTIDNPRGRRKIEQINQRLGRLKQRCSGVLSYFDIQMQDDGKKVTRLTYQRKNEVKKEKQAGCYIIRTSMANQKDEQDLWMAYRLVNEVETVFYNLKSQLNIRGNFHQEEDNIEAHINLSIQSFNIENFIRYRLKQQNINYSWKEIVRIMNTQQVMMNAISTKGDNTLWVKTCSRPIAKASQIYKAMGYKNMPYFRKTILV